MHPNSIEHVAPGWVKLSLTSGPNMLVRVAEQRGRNVITAVIVGGGELGGAVLKSIPLARIEAAINHPETRLGGSIAREMADRGASFPLRDHLERVDEAIHAVLEPGHAKGSRSSSKRSKRPPLARPDGSDPDGFSRRVADAYTDAVVTTSKPATVLAEEAGVPVGTVHRWIREARQRGHLPPARKGRAG